MVLVLGAGCPADDGDVVADDSSSGDSGDDGDGSSESGEPASSSGAEPPQDSTEGSGTTGDAETTGGQQLVCALASTEAECANGVSGAEGGCVWFPHYTVVTTDGVTCDFELAGGSCVSAIEGDTDCEPLAAACDVQVHASPNGDDYTIARTDDACFAVPELPLVDCGEVGTSPEPSFVDLVCGCGCSDDFPA